MYPHFRLASVCEASRLSSSYDNSNSKLCHTRDTAHQSDLFLVLNVQRSSVHSLVSACRCSDPAARSTASSTASRNEFSATLSDNSGAGERLRSGIRAVRAQRMGDLLELPSGSPQRPHLQDNVDWRRQAADRCTATLVTCFMSCDLERPCKLMWQPYLPL